MELYIEPIRPTFNRMNGQFLKGHEPFNKGKNGVNVQITTGLATPVVRCYRFAVSFLNYY